MASKFVKVENYLQLLNHANETTTLVKQSSLQKCGDYELVVFELDSNKKQKNTFPHIW